VCAKFLGGMEKAFSEIFFPGVVTRIETSENRSSHSDV